MPDEEVAAAAAAGEEGEDKGPSKKELKRLAKEAEKKKKQEEREAREAAEVAQKLEKALGPTLHLGNFGKSPFGMLTIDSRVRTGRTFAKLADLAKTAEAAALADTTVWARFFVQNVRKQGGKLTFLELRQDGRTIQAVANGDLAPFAAAMSRESVIDVEAQICIPDEPIASTTISDFELSVKRAYCISRADPLPLQLDDLSRADEDFEKDPALARVNLDTRLDNRIIDLRTNANQAILKLQSAVCRYFREYLISQDFTEIHTPKLLATGSEGGSNVFEVKHFDGKAYLAQSPQLYKQMALMSGLSRVFEVAPVFRAENSFTHRHATEFVGLDMEMVFDEHYHEVVDMIDSTFNYMFTKLNENHKGELEAVRKQHPFADLKWQHPSRKFRYNEAIKMLREQGPVILDERIAEGSARLATLEALSKLSGQQHAMVGDLKFNLKKWADHKESVKMHADDEDISTEDEKLIGEVIKRTHDIDFYFIDKFPGAVRPFYSMPDPEDSTWANSYDLFIRGEEIMSGAQRIHESKMLVERAEGFDVDLEPVQPYVESFKWGARPHAGGGVGMERVVMLFLALPNIRKAAMFPRDPRRLTP